MTGQSEGVGYGYTGKQLDALLGGSDHGARVLDNRMGMWWGRDRAEQWWNVWARGSDPLAMLDADGRLDVVFYSQGKLSTILQSGIEIAGIYNVNAILKQTGIKAKQEGKTIIGNALVLSSKIIDGVDFVLTAGNVKNHSDDATITHVVNGIPGGGLVAGAEVNVGVKLVLGKSGTEEIAGTGSLAVKVGAHGKAGVNIENGKFTGVAVGAGPSAGAYFGGGVEVSTPTKAYKSGN